MFFAAGVTVLAAIVSGVLPSWRRTRAAPITGIVGLIAGAIPSWRATRIDPAVILRRG